MATRSEIFDIYSQAYDRQKQAVMPLKDFLEGCRKDPSMYATAAERMLKAHPGRVIEWAVQGMLPKGRLGRAMAKKLKVYKGAEHPHAAQKPEPLPSRGRRAS